MMKRYLVLNGGLGASDYFHKQLEKMYASINISVVMSEEPILAEVKGLVVDRKQRLLTWAATLSSRLYGHQISHLIRTQKILINS
jgi:hypothetical protein